MSKTRSQTSKLEVKMMKEQLTDGRPALTNDAAAAAADVKSSTSGSPGRGRAGTMDMFQADPIALHSVEDLNEDHHKLLYLISR
jgi:hypothetical protein